MVFTKKKDRAINLENELESQGILKMRYSLIGFALENSWLVLCDSPTLSYGLTIK